MLAVTAARRFQRRGCVKAEMYPTLCLPGSVPWSVAVAVLAQWGHSLFLIHLQGWRGLTYS